MTRSSRTPRQLLADGETYLWSVRHEHHGDDGHFEDCRDVLTVRRPGALGRLELVFGREREPDGATAHGLPALDLDEPATVQALLAEARHRGIRVSPDSAERLDGWPLFTEAMRPA